MKFNSYYEYMLFIESSKKNLRDSSKIVELESCSDSEVPDILYFELSNKVDAYVSELKYHSSSKDFYKGLMRDDYLDKKHLVMLSSLRTHLAIGLEGRRQRLKEVSLDSYIKLSGVISDLENKILRKGSVANEVKRIFK